MTRRQHRKRTRVHNSQLINSNHFGLGIHHGHVVVDLTHFACTAGVPHRVEALPDQRQQFFVGLRPAREVFGPDEHWSHSLGGKELTDPLVCRNRNSLVRRICQPAWINEWLIFGIGRGNANGAARERRDESSDNGNVVIRIGWRTRSEILVVTQKSGDAKVLNFWPIRRKFIE